MHHKGQNVIFQGGDAPLKVQMPLKTPCLAHCFIAWSCWSITDRKCVPCHKIRYDHSSDGVMWYTDSHELLLVPVVHAWSCWASFPRSLNSWITPYNVKKTTIKCNFLDFKSLRLGPVEVKPFRKALGYHQQHAYHSLGITDLRYSSAYILSTVHTHWPHNYEHMFICLFMLFSNLLAAAQCNTVEHENPSRLELTNMLQCLSQEIIFSPFWCLIMNSK